MSEEATDLAALYRGFGECLEPGQSISIILTSLALFMACLCTALVSLGFTYAYMYSEQTCFVPLLPHLLVDFYSRQQGRRAGQQL